MGDFPNRASLFSVGRSFVRTAPNTRISPEVVDVPGSDINLWIGAGSLMGEAIVAAMARCLRGAFVDSAVDAQLDRVVADRFNMARKSASPALVDLTFARPTHTAGAGTILAGTVVTTPSGTQFTTDVDVVVGATDLSVQASATCTVTGPANNVPAGAVTSISSALFDTTFVVSNPAPAAGGADAESNAQLRARARQFFATIRRGVIGAIQQAALSVPGVAVATVFEVVNPYGVPAGAVELVVGDANGNATSGMLLAVKNALLDSRACGIPVFVSGGVVVYEQVVWSGLEYATNVNTLQAQANVAAVTAAVTQFLSPGAKLQRSILFTAAQQIPGVIVPDSALLAPAGDIVPSSNSVMIRVRTQDVSFQ